MKECFLATAQTKCENLHHFREVMSTEKQISSTEVDDNKKTIEELNDRVGSKKHGEKEIIPEQLDENEWCYFVCHPSHSNAGAGIV